MLEQYSAKRIPIVSVGGFLGSGKTTLINHILGACGNKRIVVFVNDFGDINIDHALISTIEDDKISLKNGCICCTLNEDLVATLMAFIRSETPPDSFLIEASGVSDLRALESTLKVIENAGHVFIDSRLYIIDTDNFQSLTYDECEAVIDSAAISDLVILNKVDVATPEQVKALRDILGVSAPYSLLFESEYCKIGMSVFTEYGRCTNSLKTQPSSIDISTLKPAPSIFSEVSLQTDRVLNRAKFESFISSLPEYCWRAKGILRFDDTPESQHVFHLVGKRASLEELKVERSSTLSEFVAIGKASELDSEAITSNFGRTYAA